MFAGVSTFTLLAPMPWPYASFISTSLGVVLGELVGTVMQPDNRRWGDTFARSRVVDR